MWFYVVLPIHVLASIFLIFVVLLQSGKGGDIAAAFGGGGTQAAFGPRASGNVLTKATAVAAALFMLTSLTLVILSSNRQSSVLDILDEAQAPAAASEPAAPEGTPADQPPATQETGGEPVAPDGE